MKDHYVSFECAQALKRLGFKEEEVSHYYIQFKSDGEVKLWSTNPPSNHNERLSNNEICSAPRLDQAAAWMRDKGIDIEINAHQHLDGESIKHQYNFGVLTINGETFANTWYNNYEKALSDAIDTALKLIGKEVKE